MRKTVCNMVPLNVSKDHVQFKVVLIKADFSFLKDDICCIEVTSLFLMGIEIV